MNPPTTPAPGPTPVPAPAPGPGPGPGSTRRAALAVLAGTLGTAAAGCSLPDVGEPFDPASELLPPDPAAPVPTTAWPGTPTLADASAAAAFFGGQFAPTTRSSFGLDLAGVLPSGDPRFRQMLRVVLPAGVANTERVYTDGPTYGGVQMFVNHTLPAPHGMYFRYYVRFPEGFEFGRGGRLPGFFGTIVKDEVRTETDRNGFATRLAWRKGNEGLVYANTARADQRVDTVGKRAWYWETGRWTCVEQFVKLNFEPLADGAMMIWIDGTLVHQEWKFNPRTSNKLRIGGLLVTAAFGDGDRSFAPTADQTVDLAAFAVGTTRIGPIAARA